MAIRDEQGYTKATIDIGDWDMDATTSVTVATGLTSAEVMTIRDISVIIRNDANNALYPLDKLDNLTTGITSGGVEIVDGGFNNIIIQRYTTGDFDNTSFDSTSYNRGWITLEYIAD